MAATSTAAERSRILAWVAYVAAWIALGLWLGLNAVIGLRNGGHATAVWEPLTWELSSAVVVAVLAVLVFRFEQRFPLSGPGALGWRGLPPHLAAAIAFSLVHTIGMVGIRVVVYSMHDDHYDFGDWRLGFAYELQKDLITYATLIGGCVAWRAIRLRREREVVVLTLQRDLSEARLAQLTAQIEPHFVFNTLNAISNRMHEDVEAADRMIAAFAELLRAALVESGSAWVRVEDDVAWLERYFELMRERYRGQLVTAIEVDAAARSARIPRLLLQPLVENAFAHGLRSGRGRIDVRIRVAEARLVCELVDDGAGISADAVDGVGLGNVRNRLALLYPGDHRFSIVAGTDGGTRVTIDLPLAAHA